MNYSLEGFIVKTRSADLLPLLKDWMFLDLEPQGEMHFADVQQSQPHALLLYRGPSGWLVLLPDTFQAVNGLQALSNEDFLLQFSSKQTGYVRGFEWGFQVAEMTGYDLGVQDVDHAIREGFRTCLGQDLEAIQPDAVFLQFGVKYNAERGRKRLRLSLNPYRRFLQAAIGKDPKAYRNGDLASGQASFETFIRQEGVPPAEVDDWCRKAYRFTNRAIEQHDLRKRHSIPGGKMILTFLVVFSLLYVLVAALISLFPATHPWSWTYWGITMGVALLLFLFLSIRLKRVPQVQVRFFDDETSQETMDRFRKEEQLKLD